MPQWVGADQLSSEVWALGSGLHGQLGDAGPAVASEAKPVAALTASLSGTLYTAIACGSGFTVVASADGLLHYVGAPEKGAPCVCKFSPAPSLTSCLPHVLQRQGSVEVRGIFIKAILPCHPHQASPGVECKHVQPQHAVAPGFWSCTWGF